MIPLLDLTRQTKALGPELSRALGRVLRKGQFILGEEVSLFEKEFARFCGARHAVGVASGTDALELSLRAAGVKPGDRVAIPSFTFMATADAVLHVGARPLFVDIDPETYTLDPADLERRIRSLGRAERARLRAVIPVHLYGHPCRMDALLRVARRHRLKVVEDAAQAAGARWGKRAIGSFGDAGCFSFFPTKNLGCFGDGGAVTTGSASAAARVRSLRVHGRREGAGLVQEELGRNSRLDELQAALLRVKLRRLKGWVAARRRLARLYTRELSKIPGLECPVERPRARHAYHLYVVRCRQRRRLQEGLRRMGIASQVYYPVPVHRQPTHRAWSRGVRLPETEKACREALALPLFPEMTAAEVRRVCRAVRSMLR